MGNSRKRPLLNTRLNSAQDNPDASSTESKAVLPLPQRFWFEKLNALNITALIFLLAILLSLPAIHGSERKMDYAGNLGRFLQRFFPPDFSASPQILSGILETIQMAVVATACAMLLALPLAAAGARTISPLWLVGIARMIMNLIRTIPGLIWALIAVAIVGANPLAGVIGLSFYSLGYLGKFFSDAFESVDLDVAAGLRAMGASPIQSFQHGLLPHVKPLIWSYSLWMLEYNIRSASIIGYVGAGGVGVLLFTYQQFYQWDKFCAVLIYILVLVSLLDFLGEWVRGKITKRINRPLASS